jgi:hypothetical protein
MRIASLLLVATSLTMVPPPAAMAAKPGDLPFELASNLPIVFSQYVLSERALDPYKLAAPINPFYLQGDFNGDGRSDFAIWILEGRQGSVVYSFFTAVPGRASYWPPGRLLIQVVTTSRRSIPGTSFPRERCRKALITKNCRRSC